MSASGRIGAGREESSCPGRDQLFLQNGGHRVSESSIRKELMPRDVLAGRFALDWALGRAYDAAGKGCNFRTFLRCRRTVERCWSG